MIKNSSYILLKDNIFNNKKMHYFYISVLNLDFTKFGSILFTFFL